MIEAAAYWRRLLKHALQIELPLVQMILAMQTVLQRITVRRKGVSGHRNSPFKGK